MLNHSDAFLSTFTENLLAYGLGRVIDYRDMPVVRAIDRERPQERPSFSAFVLGIVKSAPFQMRRAEEPGPAKSETGERAIRTSEGSIQMQFVTKKHLSRRTVLRGVGAALSLPLLDSMVPAQTPLRKTVAASSPTRLACIEMVHGAAGSTGEGTNKHYWSPEKDGTDFEFSQTLEPLEPYRDYITIVSDTDLHPATAWSAAEEGADHFRSSAVYLTAAHPKMTEGSDYYVGHVDRSDLRAAIRPGHAAAVASSFASRWWMLRAPAITATPACMRTPSVGRRRPRRCR